MAQTFDTKSLRLTGDAVPVACRVGTAGNAGYGAFTASTRGTLVYGAGPQSRDMRLQWSDRRGTPEGSLGVAVPAERNFRLSFDGKRLAVAQDRAIYLQPVSGGPPSQIVGEGQPADSPVWSPDGKGIVFSKLGARFDLFPRHLDGSANEEPLDVAGLNVAPWDWSRDGKWIVFGQEAEKTGIDIWLLPLEGQRKPLIFLQTLAAESQARFSPDGHWMAFVQYEQGRDEVFVQAISPQGPAAGVKYRVSSAGGSHPAWRRDGRELFFASADKKMMAVPVILGAVFQAAPAQTLFSLPSESGNWDVSADGLRFLVEVPEHAGTRWTSLSVVLNWPVLLKK